MLLTNVIGNHELSLFVDAKLMIVASKEKLMWAPFKFEENTLGGGDMRDIPSR